MPEIKTADELTDESIREMDKQSLINSVIYSFDIPDEFERIRLQALMQIRAGELNISTAVSRMISAYSKKDAENEKLQRRSQAKHEAKIPIKLDEKGAPCITIDNFLVIMRNDPYYAGIRYNLLMNAPEIHTVEDGKLTVSAWSDADEAESRHYIESRYNIHSEHKHLDALRILFREREYNPIRDIIDTIEWDGKDRISRFLIEWMQADDTEYTREVSRLIFAGGINRLYAPGCKFDDVPVLIGTKQGEGKSTIVRWLSVNDQFFSEVTEIDGQRAIEQLEGAWICEIAELLALTKAKEQEAVKSYITRQRDKYRKPYDRQTSEYPRRCIFIGTTNNENFLKDKTGNRRFYPVVVHSSAYWLYEHEQECREYILQCWAEARTKYERGDPFMQNFANQDLKAQFSDAQENAMEDDWRVGAMEEYLNKLPVGSLVCIRQLKREALSPSVDFPQDPTPKETLEIGILMNKFNDWEKAGRQYIDKYGRQRCWKRVSGFQDISDENCVLPF